MNKKRKTHGLVGKKPGLVKSLIKKQRGLCFHCKRPMVKGNNVQNAMSLDHIIPVSLGGANKSDNMILSCRACNSRRGNLDMDEFALYNTIRPGKARLKWVWERVLS